MRLFYYFLDVAIVNTHILKSESPSYLFTCRIRKKKKFQFRTQKNFVLELIEELIGSHVSCKKMDRPKIPVDVVCVTPNSTTLQCMTNLQNVYVVVSRVQGNDQNMGVIDVEAFTSVATLVLRNITLN